LRPGLFAHLSTEMTQTFFYNEIVSKKENVEVEVEVEGETLFN
jgi:hypothetical protein